MDTIWAVVGIVAPAIYGAGLVMIKSAANIRFAKLLFWSSAALLGTWCFAWQLMTEQPAAIRIVVGLLVGAFVFVLVPETIRRMAYHETLAAGDKEKPGIPGEAAPPGTSNAIGDVTGNRGIITQGQRGDNKQ
jgi:hypothetical protein